MKKVRVRPAIADCVVLFCVSLLSALPYLFKLGFYSDDWAYQEALARSSNGGIGAMIRELMKGDQGISLRPAQIAYLVVGFKAFGRHATPYHCVNAAVLGLVTVLLYLVLYELRTGRWLAFVVAVVFGLLPHYATDRFWIASHQATFSMAFALFGIFALLRSVKPESRISKTWAALAGLAFVLSVLSYEVALGLIVASFVMVGVRAYIDARATSQRPSRRIAGLLIPAVVLLPVGLVKAWKQTRIAIPAHFPHHLGQRMLNAVVQSLQFNLCTYGVKMPAVLVSLYRHSALSLPAVCCASIVALLVSAYLWIRMERHALQRWRECLWLIAAGYLLFALGYGLFFFDPQTDFSSAGLDNRVVIASALGVPCVLIGALGLAFSTLKSQIVRARVFAVAIGAICGINCLVVNGVGFFWVRAASQQAAILKSVSDNVRSLPRGSVLLLDGFCRYFGPAVVFETDWDSTGAIRLRLGDSSLTSDVVSPNMRLHDATVETRIYGDQEGSYSYGDRLFVFNVQRQILANWGTKEAALAYLHAADPTQDSGCPASKEGRGAKIF